MGMTQDYQLEVGEIMEKDGWFHIRCSMSLPTEVWPWLYANCKFTWHILDATTNQRRFVFHKYEDAVLFKMTWL